MTPLGTAVASDEGVTLHVKKACTHSRLIDDVLTKKGNKTGRLLCLECKATFPDLTLAEPVR
jgi:hypothetical protein